MNVAILDVEQLPLVSELEKFRRNPPDKCFIARDGHCGIWVPQTPDNSERYGIIGHYHARNSHQSQNLLELATTVLRDRGCSRVYGPMDGNTWHSYRFVTWSDGSPPFLMEPLNPPEWPEYWQQSGFAPCHEYVSTSVSNLRNADPRLQRAKERLRNAGVSWRPIDLGQFKEELEQVYMLSLEAFKNNILYTEIEKTTFLNQYLPFAGSIESKYVLLAHDQGGKCCGFIFAIPDLLQQQRGVEINRLIIKTLAVSPNRQRGGLGAVLVDEIQKTAFESGLQSAIHALMHAGNVSANIGKTSSPLRRYTLFEKVLS